MTAISWTTGDGRVLVAELPKKKPINPKWKKGYVAGLRAMAACLQDGAGGAVKTMHGGRVFMLCDHDIDTAMQAAMTHLRRSVGEKEGGEDE